MEEIILGNPETNLLPVVRSKISRNTSGNIVFCMFLICSFFSPEMESISVPRNLGLAMGSALADGTPANVRQTEAIKALADGDFPFFLGPLPKLRG